MFSNEVTSCGIKTGETKPGFSRSDNAVNGNRKRDLKKCVFKPSNPCLI